MAKPRNYKREYELYHGKPEQIANRAARNKARATMADKGLVRKGDGKDVDHVRPISKGGSSDTGNLRVASKSANRSFARSSTNQLLSQTSKREARKGRK